MHSDWLPFGILGRPHGTRGELHVRPYGGFGADSALRAFPASVLLSREDATREIGVVGIRPVGDGLLIRFEGVVDRQAAAELVGHEIRLPRATLASLGEAEFYVEDIVGCEVLDPGGRSLGRVRGTFWNGAHDVMVIADENGGERFVPVVAEYVLSFDGDGRRLVVDPHD